jgi:hypothetical protein
MTKIMAERSNDNGTRTVPTENVADILERELDPIIGDRMRLVEKQEDLMSVGLSYEHRTGHLPRFSWSAHHARIWEQHFDASGV